MDKETNLRLKLSRIYKIKKDLIQELNLIKKDLSSAVKNLPVIESIPESEEFGIFFRDFEYSRLNKLITEYVNLLEKPLSGDTEEIYYTEIDNINSTISEAVSNLSKTVKKINEFIHKISGGEENLPFESYIANVKAKVNSMLDKEIKKEIKPDIDKLKEKLHFIYRYDDYNGIINFLKTYEREVNIYLSQKGSEKLSKIFEKYKNELFKEIVKYIGRYIKSSKAKQKVVDEIKNSLDAIQLAKHSVHYTLPDIRKHFRDLGADKSRIDIIIGNLESPRFLGILSAGLGIFVIGLFLPLPEGIKELTVLTGFFISIYSFFDSAFFNRFYIKKYIKQVRDNIKDDVEKSTEMLLSTMKEKILRSTIKVENIAISIVNRETKTIKEFENFLVNLRNNIEKHILVISNIKKDLDLELSEEN